MARKFNNGQRLGDVRDILNGNADEINNKVDKVTGKGLSTNDYTNDDKAKLQALGTGSGGTAPDLSGYVAKREGYSLVSDAEQQRLSDIQKIDTTQFVVKDGTKVLSDRNYTASKDDKLGGVAFSATKNSPDATLLSRANHTGTQAISTVTGLQAALDAPAAKVVNSIPQTGQPTAYRFASGTKPTTIPSDVIFFEI